MIDEASLIKTIISNQQSPIKILTDEEYNQVLAGTEEEKTAVKKKFIEAYELPRKQARLDKLKEEKLKEKEWEDEVLELNNYIQ